MLNVEAAAAWRSSVAPTSECPSSTGSSATAAAASRFIIGMQMKHGRCLRLTSTRNHQSRSTPTAMSGGLFINIIANTAAKPSCQGRARERDRRRAGVAGTIPHATVSRETQPTRSRKTSDAESCRRAPSRSTPSKPAYPPVQCLRAWSVSEGVSACAESGKGGANTAGGARPLAAPTCRASDVVVELSRRVSACALRAAASSTSAALRHQAMQRTRVATARGMSRIQRSACRGGSFACAAFVHARRAGEGGREGQRASERAATISA